MLVRSRSLFPVVLCSAVLLSSLGCASAKPRNHWWEFCPVCESEIKYTPISKPRVCIKHIQQIRDRAKRDLTLQRPIEVVK